MDKRYFQIIEQCAEMVTLATALTNNANFRDDVDARTRPFLVFIAEQLEKSRRILQEQVSRQMSDDPQERDADLTTHKQKRT